MFNTTLHKTFGLESIDYPKMLRKIFFIPDDITGFFYQCFYNALCVVNFPLPGF